MKNDSGKTRSAGAIDRQRATAEPDNFVVEP